MWLNTNFVRLVGGEMMEDPKTAKEIRILQATQVIDSETYMSAGMQTILKTLVNERELHAEAIVESEEHIKDIEKTLNDSGLNRGT